MPFISSLKLDSFLSFAPDNRFFDFDKINILIGPNGSGKSNIIEALELLKATPVDFASAIRDGGGPSEWLWKGQTPPRAAKVDVVVDGDTPTHRPLRYRLEFAAVQGRVEVLDEAIEEKDPQPGNRDPFFYYRFQRGSPVISVREHGTVRTKQRHLERDTLQPDQSVLAQRKDPENYPEVTWLGKRFSEMQTFREWSFGRYAPLRQPQPTDLPEDRLLPDGRNLALVLNQIEHIDGNRFNGLLRRFFPRYARMTTRVSGGTVQFYLHESGFSSPIPPTRLSDGTIRFVALLATLLAPVPPPLICIEEPELGLHPDAITMIADLMIEASERTQIVATTHSDALVSAFTELPGAIITCERPGPGTVLRRLESDMLSKWLENYRLGDLWRMGELGANP